MNFKKWLEVGMGSGGVGGGLEPAQQNPIAISGSFSDYHGKNSSDPSNPNGQLPPTKKRKKV